MIFTTQQTSGNEGPLEVIGSSWDGYVDLLLEEWLCTHLSERAKNVLFHSLHVTTLGELFALDWSCVIKGAEFRYQTAKEIINFRNMLFSESPEEILQQLKVMPAKKAFSDMPMEEQWRSQLPIRAANTLFGHLNIKTYGDFFALDLKQVMEVRNAGKKTLQDIIALKERIISEIPEAKELVEASKNKNIVNMPMIARWRSQISVRASHVLFDQLNIKTYGDFFALDFSQIKDMRNAGKKTLLDIVSLKERILSEIPETQALVTNKKSVWDEADKLPLDKRWLPKMSKRTAKFLFETLNARTFGDLFALDCQILPINQEIDRKILRTLNALKEEIISEGPEKILEAFRREKEAQKQESIIVEYDPATFLNFATFASVEAEKHFDFTSNFGIVWRDYLAMGDGAQKHPLEYVSRNIGLSRERVRQLAQIIITTLFRNGKEKQYKLFSDKIKALYEENDGIIKSGKLGQKVDEAFGWSGTTDDNVFSFMKCLGLPIKDIIVKPIPLSQIRTEALKAVMESARTKGLTFEEIVTECERRFPEAQISIGTLRSYANTQRKFDDSGTRLIGFTRGNKEGETTRYSLNTFFKDDATVKLLNQAGEEVKAYMEQHGFGVVGVWKIWNRYHGRFAFDFPKLGFYMMMREIKAGGLEYSAYPKIFYPGMEKCDNVYEWELFIYFYLCGHTTAKFAQLATFFQNCLGIQPNVALAYVGKMLKCKMNTNDDGETIYELKPPRTDMRPPKVLLLDKINRDPSMPLISSHLNNKSTIPSCYFDENGHALTHWVYVKTFMRALAKVNFVLPRDQIACLSDGGWCKSRFAMPCPILRSAEGLKRPPWSSYSRERFRFGDEDFFITTQWGPKNKTTFDAWAKQMAGLAGIPFDPYEIVGLSSSDETEDD